MNEIHIKRKIILENDMSSSAVLNITASYANTASQAINSTFANSSSYSFTSSWAPTVSASYALLASNSTTASFLNGSAISNNIKNKNVVIPIIQSGNISVVAGLSKIVNFSTSMADTNYSISILAGSLLSSFFITGKTVNGFTASFALFTGNFDWTAIGYTQ